MTTPKVQGKDPGEAESPQKFSQMTTGGKLVFIGKVVIFLLSFGFAFPTLFSD